MSSESPNVDAMHLRRVRRMLTLGSAMMGGYGVVWAGYFIYHGLWLAVGLDVLTLCSAGAVLWLTRREQLRLASRVLLAALFGLLCSNAAVVDVPSPDFPRTAHHFLLVVGAASGLLMRSEAKWLRHGVPLSCLATWALLTGSDVSLPAQMSLPQGVRAWGGWVNLLTTAASLYGALVVIQADVVERNSMERELLDAMVHGDLSLHYQPQVNAHGKVVGAEALVRWRHPQRGKISPGVFIPLAERCGLMPALGEWVRQTACTQLAAWALDQRTSPLVLSVNVSMLELGQPDFVERVINSVERFGIHPSRLKLEITESALAQDMNDIVAKMQALKLKGIKLSLDDFGTGFSSLSYLRRLPLDQLKIDKSFVHNILSSPQDEAIVQTVVDLGSNLGLEVIAEGVETVQQQQFLAGMGCDIYQGNLFSRPLTSAGFDLFLKRIEAQRQRPGRPVWFEDPTL